MAKLEDPYPVVMPKLGLTMTEATLLAWHVADGERVEKGAPLFTLETAKTSLDIEAPASGVVRRRCAEGESVPVQTVVATLEGAAPERPAEAPAPSARRVRATPRARHRARELGVALTELSGTGPRAMIVVADVEAAHAAGRAPRATPVARRVAEHLGVDLAGVEGTGARGAVTRADVERAVARPTQRDAAPPTARPEAQPLTGLRAVIAERISTGWRERPQVTLNTEIDATPLVRARRQLNDELAGRGEKVSYNAFLVLAVARALSELPYVNVQWHEGGVLQMPGIHVGLAVDTDRGLLVPVVRDADAKGLLAINRELADLARRAIAGRSLPDELAGGTFTVTNLGMYEIDDFTPIINPPESAILGVGRIVARPVVLDGQVVVRQRVTLSLSFDHRLIDGAPAARFLQRVKHLLERPVVLLL